MKLNLKTKKFVSFFQNLQKRSSYTEDEDDLIKLKIYRIILFDCFLWRYRTSYLKLVESFLKYQISGDEFAEKLIGMRSRHFDEFNQLALNSKI
jgi:hypothetical protein